MKNVLLLFVSLSLFSAMAQAQVYKWKDENGKIHYGQKPQANSEQVKATVNSAEGSASSGKLVMFSTTRCGYCKKARRYFNENGIAFVEKNIETSRTAKMDYDKLGARGVPVLLLNDERMNGFSESGFKRFYKRATER